MHSIRSETLGTFQTHWQDHFYCNESRCFRGKLLLQTSDHLVYVCVSLEQSNFINIAVNSQVNSLLLYLGTLGGQEQNVLFQCKILHCFSNAKFPTQPVIKLPRDQHLSPSFPHLWDLLILHLGKCGQRILLPLQ